MGSNPLWAGPCLHINIYNRLIHVKGRAREKSLWTAGRSVVVSPDRHSLRCSARRRSKRAPPLAGEARRSRTQLCCTQVWSPLSVRIPIKRRLPVRIETEDEGKGGREEEMNEEPLDISGGASRSPAPPVLLRPRREVFEYGLLPLPKLIFTDGTSTLETLKRKLLERAVSRQEIRIDARGVAEVLDISIDHAILVLDTLASVLPSDPDSHTPEGTADVYDLVIFLYIQSYKRLLPKGHKDSTSVGDVWPHSSPFDRYLSVLSPLQVLFYLAYS